MILLTNLVLTKYVNVASAFVYSVKVEMYFVSSEVSINFLQLSFLCVYI